MPPSHFRTSTPLARLAALLLAIMALGQPLPAIAQINPAVLAKAVGAASQPSATPTDATPIAPALTDAFEANLADFERRQSAAEGDAAGLSPRSLHAYLSRLRALQKVLCLAVRSRPHAIPPASRSLAASAAGLAAS